MLLAQYWRSFQNCAIFDCERGAVLDDLRHDEGRGGEKLMNCQRSDVLVLRMLVRPVKMNPCLALDLLATVGTHNNSWLMFTPTELLKQFLKEAFAREGVPASDQRIRAWYDYLSEG